MSLKRGVSCSLKPSCHNTWGHSTYVPYGDLILCSFAKCEKITGLETVSNGFQFFEKPTKNYHRYFRVINAYRKHMFYGRIACLITLCNVEFFLVFLSFFTAKFIATFWSNSGVKSYLKFQKDVELRFQA